MKLNSLKQQWGDIRLENMIGRITIPILAVALLISVLVVVNQKPIITIVPPNMTETAQVAHNNAGESFKRAYGLYVIQMMGNVHPGTVDFLVQALNDILHPSIYHEVKEEIMDQVDLIRHEDLSISFQARSVDFWADTNRVVIHGDRVTEGRGQEKMFDRVTYEVEVAIRNYLPQITFVSVYNGRPERRR